MPTQKATRLKYKRKNKKKVNTTKQKRVTKLRRKQVAPMVIKQTTVIHNHPQPKTRRRRRTPTTKVSVGSSKRSMSGYAIDAPSRIQPQLTMKSSMEAAIYKLQGQMKKGQLQLKDAHSAPGVPQPAINHQMLQLMDSVTKTRAMMNYMPNVVSGLLDRKISALKPERSAPRVRSRVRLRQPSALDADRYLDAGVRIEELQEGEPTATEIDQEDADASGEEEPDVHPVGRFTSTPPMFLTPPPPQSSPPKAIPPPPPSSPPVESTKAFERQSMFQKEVFSSSDESSSADPPPPSLSDEQVFINLMAGKRGIRGVYSKFIAAQRLSKGSQEAKQRYEKALERWNDAGFDAPEEPKPRHKRGKKKKRK